MSKKSRQDFRLAIGNRDSHRSSVWKIWVQKNDIYIHSRMFGSDAKVSLHESGDCQWSMTTEWVKRQEKSVSNAARHIEKWKMPQIEANSAACIFKIVIPKSELRKINIHEKLENVHWLQIPKRDSAIEIDLYLTPPSLTPIPEKNIPFNILFSFQLYDKRWLIAIYHEERVNEDNDNELKRLRSESIVEFKKRNIRITPQHRVTGLFAHPMGYKGLIELVPYSSLNKILLIGFIVSLLIFFILIFILSWNVFSP